MVPKAQIFPSGKAFLLWVIVAAARSAGGPEVGDEEDALRVQHRSVGEEGRTPSPPLWWPALIDVMNVIRCYRRDRSAWPLSLSLPGFLDPTEWANNASEWCAGRGTDGPEDREGSQRDQFSVSVVVTGTFKPLSL